MKSLGGVAKGRAPVSQWRITVHPPVNLAQPHQCFHQPTWAWAHRIFSFPGITSLPLLPYFPHSLVSRDAQVPFMFPNPYKCRRIKWEGFTLNGCKCILISSFYLIVSRGFCFSFLNSSLQTAHSERGQFSGQLSGSFHTFSDAQATKLIVSCSQFHTAEMTQKCNWNTCSTETVPEITNFPLGISSFRMNWYFSLKVLTSRKQHGSIIDNIPHFWEFSVGPIFPFSPSQFFVLKTPKCN